jgi:hypothetical protein
MLRELDIAFGVDEVACESRDDEVRHVGSRLLVLSVDHTENVTRELDHGVLESATRPEKRRSLFSREPDGAQRPRGAGVRTRGNAPETVELPQWSSLIDRRR